MALERLNKTINLVGNSVVDGEIVAQFIASFDTSNPNIMVPMRTVMNVALYRQNRTTVMADQEAFEVYAYELLDSFVADAETEGEVTDATE